MLFKKFLNHLENLKIPFIEENVLSLKTHTEIKLGHVRTNPKF